MNIQYGSLNTMSNRHSDRKNEIDHQQEQYENLKWKLERKLRELDGELALQRQVAHCWGLVLPWRHALPASMTSGC